MRVCSDRSFRFGVAPDALWSVLADVDGYQRWWPWLRRFDATGLVAGDVWHCTVQPPLPYTLDFTVTLDAVDPPNRVEATVAGDIEGTAFVEISACGQGSEAHLVSALSPRSAVLRAVAVMAGPVVRYGHDWVLDNGARQLAARAR